MINKNSKILFESTKEAVDSHFTDEELDLMINYHIKERQSCVMVNNYSMAMEHILQIEYCKDALIERQSIKPII